MNESDKTERLVVHWPDYNTSFVFAISLDDELVWTDDRNELPQGLRLLLAAAVRNLEPDSTLGEEVLSWLEGMSQSRQQPNKKGKQNK